MKSKKTYAAFLSAAIAVSNCAYASNPDPDSLPCGDALGSMLGAPAQPSTPMREEPTYLEREANGVAGDILAELTKNQYRTAYYVLSKIRNYITSHQADSYDALKAWTKSKLPRPNSFYSYWAPRDHWNDTYCYHYCTGDDVAYTLVKHFTCCESFRDKYESTNDVIAYILAGVANLPESGAPTLLRLARPADAPTAIEINWLEKMLALFD